MPYSQFNIETIQSNLGIQVQDRRHLFSDVSPIPYSDFLTQSLEEYSPIAIAIGTEKSRSEFIIAPILFEIKKQLTDNNMTQQP